ncbi:BamA/TamA family outer membrane protein [candidate division KSB1 bacterium]|nr:BamA/TamA family outer membrane protein [candidate division KSB1 bacterium]
MYSPCHFPSLGSDYRRESFSTHLFFGRRFSSDEYAFLEAAHGRIQQKGKTIEKVTNGRLTFFSTRLRNQTLAGSVSFSQINFRQPFTQLFLGENTGLRGFLNREFIGDRRILINLENRVFSNYRLMSARFGGVLFFDSGKIWNTGEGFDSGKWRTSMGIGLRLGIPKFSQGIIRIDVAYNFDQSKFSTVSFSNGSYFRVLFPMQIGIQNFDFTISN